MSLFASDRKQFRVTVQTGDDTHLRRNGRTQVYEPVSEAEALRLEREAFDSMRDRVGGCCVLTEPLPDSPV